MVDLLFFAKHLGRLAITILTRYEQRERRNNSSLKLLKLNSLSICTLFGSTFAVYLAGATKLFFVIG